MWLKKRWRAAFPIPLFDRQDHPSVPTWLPESTARRGRQGCPKGTAIAARSVLDGPEHGAAIGTRRASDEICGASRARSSCLSRPVGQVVSNLLLAVVVVVWTTLFSTVAVNGSAYAAVSVNLMHETKSHASLNRKSIFVVETAIGIQSDTVILRKALDVNLSKDIIAFSLKHRDEFPWRNTDKIWSFLGKITEQVAIKKWEGLYRDFRDVSHVINRRLPNDFKAKFSAELFPFSKDRFGFLIDKHISSKLPDFLILQDNQLVVGHNSLAEGNASCKHDSDKCQPRTNFLTMFRLGLLACGGLGLGWYAINVAPYRRNPIAKGVAAAVIATVLIGYCVNFAIALSAVWIRDGF